MGPRWVYMIPRWLSQQRVVSFVHSHFPLNSLAKLLSVFLVLAAAGKKGSRPLQSL